MAIKNAVQGRVLSINYAYGKSGSEYLCRDLNLNVKPENEEGLPTTESLKAVGNALGSLLKKEDRTGLSFKDKTISKLVEEI